MPNKFITILFLGDICSTLGREVTRSLTSAIFGKSTAASRIAGNIGSSLGRNILGTLLKG